VSYHGPNWLKGSTVRCNWANILEKPQKYAQSSAERPWSAQEVIQVLAAQVRGDLTDLLSKTDGSAKFVAK
jgi:hypothetical protein